MDCFVASLLAMTVDAVLRSRGAMRPKFFKTFSPKRGSRECRVHAAPAVSCAKVRIENAHEHTGTVGTLRHSLRNGFTAYAALSPETNSSCLRRWRISGWSNPVGSTSPPLNLAPATGVGTTRFCRTLQRRSSCAASAHSRKTALRTRLAPDAAASTASHPNVRDDRDTSLVERMRCANYGADFGETGSGIFLREGTGRVESD